MWDNGWRTEAIEGGHERATFGRNRGSSRKRPHRLTWSEIIRLSLISFALISCWISYRFQSIRRPSCGNTRRRSNSTSGTWGQSTPSRDAKHHPKINNQHLFDIYCTYIFRRLFVWVDWSSPLTFQGSVDGPKLDDNYRVVRRWKLGRTSAVGRKIDQNSTIRMYTSPAWPINGEWAWSEIKRDWTRSGLP